MIIGPVKFMYYMMLNKGNIAGDPDVLGNRLNMPMTITEDCAEECILKICNQIADVARQPGSVKLIKLTTYDFCHFVKYGSQDIINAITNTAKNRIIKPTRTMNGPFRRIK